MFFLFFIFLFFLFVIVKILFLCCFACPGLAHHNLRFLKVRQGLDRSGRLRGFTSANSPQKKMLKNKSENKSEKKLTILFKHFLWFVFVLNMCSDLFFYVFLTKMYFIFFSEHVFWRLVVKFFLLFKHLALNIWFFLRFLKVRQNNP